MDTGTFNEHVYLNGSFIAQEGNPTGQGDNWAAFDVVGVNNAGNYIFTGDTDGATATDEFVAYNGVIGVREGATVDGVTLATGASIRAASINNLDEVAHIWGWGSGSSTQEHLFFGDGADLANSLRLLSIGDELDENNDGIADWLVTDLNASASIGPGLSLAEDGYIYVEIGMMPVAGGSEIDAIIRLAVPEPGALSVLALLATLALRRR
jgi:hypothetical protein